MNATLTERGLNMNHRYLKNTTTLELKTDACIGCGMCIKVCPHAVFEIAQIKVNSCNESMQKTDSSLGCENTTQKTPARADNRKTMPKAVIVDKDACMECGACAMNCPANAIQVQKGVGCAYAIIMGKLLGTEPTCGCDNSKSASSGCC
jgi:NAD-dependent dihydropyrimidine dehydrogenase PreA subunit